MHATVALLFFEVWMAGEGMLVTVLKDEVTAGMENVLGKHLVRQRLQTLKGIWRVGEDYIELLVADRQKVKDVVPDHSHVVKAQAPGFSLDEGSILPDHLDRIHPRSSTGSKFEGNRTGASEKVKDLQVLEFIFIVQDIEQPFPGEIRGRPGLVACRRIDSLSLESPADDPHICSTLLK